MENYEKYLAAFFIGVIVSLFPVAVWQNYKHTRPDRHQKCLVACEPNGGIEASYYDGDCDCVNGAEFSWVEIQGPKS